jgi:hypothetical protein
MGKLILYQVVVLWHPDMSNDDQKKMETTIIFEPKFMLAKDEQTLAYQMIRQVPEKYVETINQVQVLIRPF